MNLAPSAGTPTGVDACPGASPVHVPAKNVRSDPVTRRAKAFNLDTYKYHSLGDYLEHIRHYGTTDSYSTEPVCPHGLAGLFPADRPLLQGELEHRTSKMRYKHTDRKEFVKQMI